MFEDLRDNNQVFSGMFSRFSTNVSLGYGDRAAQIPAEVVSGSYFPVLGVVLSNQFDSTPVSIHMWRHQKEYEPS